MGEKAPDSPGLGKIVVHSPRAVQVDIINIFYCNFAIFNGFAHGRQGTLAPGMWFYRVMGIAGQAGAQQPGDGSVSVVCRQQQYGRPLGD